MRRGFQYDSDLCVNCKACSAACILENGFQPETRSVYSWNSDALEPFPVINLSLACNHCSNPACLTGCPAKAYTTDSTGAVIHHPERCMGCGYCTWKCPYDAPKINIVKGYIEKCHFCYERAKDGIDPACVTACPTGAINTIYLEDFPAVNAAWFPETGINPSVKISGVAEKRSLHIYPEETQYSDECPPAAKTRIGKEWSLLVFSTLVIFAAALIISSYFSDSSGYKGVAGLMLVTSMVISFLHLGVFRNVWRAPLNFISSQLSREIVSVTVLTIMCAIDFFKPHLLPSLVTPVMALLTLAAVDMVYFTTDRSLSLKLHSGQAFFSGLLAVSLLTFSLAAFIVFTLLAALSVVIRHKYLPKRPLIHNLFYYRALSLPLALMPLYFRAGWSLAVAIVLLFTGILADRILFFNDFKPENIKDKIQENFSQEYEKERDKQSKNSGLS